MATAKYPSKDADLTGKIYFNTVDENGTLELGGNQIILPIPPGITFQDGAAYENADLGAFGSAFADGRFLDAAKSYIDEGNFGAQASNLVKDLAAKVGGNRVRSRMGRTPNPNTRALFKQVNLRTFSFTFKMIPTSSDESDEIVNVVKYFRQELYPTPTSESARNFQTGYFFPKRWDIAFYLLSGDGSFSITDDVPKIQPAYLTAIQTAYNSSTPAMYTEPGAFKARFSEVDISLTFLESKTLFQKDVKDGF